MSFGGSSPKVQQTPAPSVAATPPPPETVAEAPVVNENRKSKEADTKRQGTAALRINLNIGGVGGIGAGGTGNASGLTIPR